MDDSMGLYYPIYGGELLHFMSWEIDQPLAFSGEKKPACSA